MRDSHVNLISGAAPLPPISMDLEIFEKNWSPKGIHQCPNAVRKMGPKCP